MATSKARKYACCTLALLCVVAVIVCLVVFLKCPAGSFARGAVAADSQTCSEIGRDILQQGGSAVDGAIAALLCTTVVNPQSMGIGGGAIFTVMDSSGNVKIINARETVPGNFKSDLLQSCPKSLYWALGSQWIGIPGEIRGYEQAHKLYGKLPWATLFQPAIRLAREGIPIRPILGRYLSFLNANQTQALRNLFSDKDGNLLKTGDIVRFEKLADTLEMIANHGADVLYTGQIAEELIRDIKEAGYSLNSLSLRGKQKSLAYHYYAEAFKFANGLKKQIHTQYTSEKITKKFTDDAFADYIRSLISINRTHESQYYNITPHLEGMGTSHVSVLAEDGSAVSVTSTINLIFGSTILSPRTGVILNNQLIDFCGRVDKIATGDQPPSSVTPAVLKSHSKTLVIGCAGGSMITTGMASTLMNHLWFGKSLKEAIATPVVFVDSQNSLKFEPKFDQDVIKDLKALGHHEETSRLFFNVVNAVGKEDGCICAVSDARKMGQAAGY